MSIQAAERMQGVRYAVRDILVVAEKAQAAGKEMLYLNIGDPNIFDYETPPVIIEAIVKAMRDGHTGYAPSAGIAPSHRSGTVYLYDSSKLLLNTAWLQKRDYITIGVATGIFTGVGFLLALGSHSLTKKFKVLDEINYRDIQQIQIKKTNNRNAIIASSLLFLGLVSQAGHPKWGPVLGFIGIPLSLTPFLLKPYFSYSWETIYNANEGGQDDPMPPQT